MLPKVLFTPNSAVYVTTPKLIPYLHFVHGHAILISDPRRQGGAMHYTGTIWRSPYEADSLLLEATAG